MVILFASNDSILDNTFDPISRPFSLSKPICHH